MTPRQLAAVVALLIAATWMTSSGQAAPESDAVRRRLSSDTTDDGARVILAKHHKHKHQEDEDEDENENYRGPFFREQQSVYFRQYYGPGGYPNLPPGIRKHLERTGHLPPGLEKKFGRSYQMPPEYDPDLVPVSPYVLQRMGPLPPDTQ